MVAWISNWAQGIITAVIIASVIEMIIPNGSSKKYIKVVIGTFILFSTISPVVNKFKSGSIENMPINLNINSKTEEVSANVLDKKAGFNIKTIYEGNLKADIKSKIKAKGFSTGNVSLQISDDDEYRIEKLDINIISKEEKNNSRRNNVIGIVDTVDKVSIEITNKVQNISKEYQISESDQKKLKEYLSETYDIDKTDITIN